MGAPFGPPRQATDQVRRLDSLTSLRWFAALGVFLVHMSLVVKLIVPFYFRSAEAGAAAGVSFFFMLSGLVLAWARSDDNGNRAFWQNRFARVWPMHFAALIAALVLPWVIAGAPPVASHIPPVFFLVQSWIPNQGWYFAPNIVSWTLACEAFFYATFPWLHRRIQVVRRPVALLVGLLALVWVLPLLTLPLNADRTEWALYIFPVARLAEFCIGIVLCRLVREGRVRWTNPYLPAVVVVAAILSARWMPIRFVYVAWAAIPLAWLLAAAAARNASGRRSALEARPLVRLGEISFAFYLVHAQVARWLPTRIGILQHGFLRRPTPFFIVLLLASIACAWVFHEVIEVPFERILRAKRARVPTD